MITFPMLVITIIDSDNNDDNDDNHHKIDFIYSNDNSNDKVDTDSSSNRGKWK